MIPKDSDSGSHFTPIRFNFQFSAKLSVPYQNNLAARGVIENEKVLFFPLRFINFTLIIIKNNSFLYFEK